ncbi:glycosyl transferase [Terrabacter tumescens]|uniref:Glycosyl transferase n=1 Tax=Terrabacter tumescens TaxID=60443 RepID=A0ABQ2I0J9_9MICO|nr:glycosyltransferase family 2 protein [Terrabacter tumescens]GGM94682.1 glycosyl transferase [Terrabacter tumescens]
MALTAYTYVGYPALAALLARRQQAGTAADDDLPSVSVVVSALDERDVIGRRLDNLRELDYPEDLLEVVVVTDGSSDGTDVEARRHAWPGVVVLHDPRRRGKAAAMGRGVACATHEVVVFSDANNSYAPDALREVVRPLADPRVGAVTGAKAVDGGESTLSGGEKLYWRYESFIKRQESLLGCCTGVVGELLAVRRDLVPEFPKDLVNDDFFIAMHVARSGRRVAYAPAAMSWEPAAISMSDDVVRRRRMTAGRWQSLVRWRSVLPVGQPLVIWQVVSHKYLRLLLPFSMGTALVAGWAAVARSSGDRRTLRGLTLAQTAFYGLAAVGGAVPVSAGPIRSAALGARYLTRTNLASAEGLVAYLRGRRSLHLWARVPRSQDTSGP